MRYIILLVSFFFAISANAISLLDDAPDRYVVKPGDTLWGIANKYLTHPWDWKALLRANPQIKNPKHLYPGAVLELHSVAKSPYIKVLSNGTIKLSPHMRPMPAEDPIPTIPLDDIKPFFDNSVVLDRDSLISAPFILAFTTEHLLGTQGDMVYVKNLCSPVPPPGTRPAYSIYRMKGEYHHPADDRCLGYKVEYIGSAELVRGGDPATILITNIAHGVRKLDRVLPANYPAFDLTFDPKAPGPRIDAEIIDIQSDYNQGASGLVVVLDIGKINGIDDGDVLAVYAKQRCVPNPAPTFEKTYDPKKDDACVLLPPERIGEVMVFRTFTQTSFALVMRSIRSIHKYDTVTNP